MEKQMKPRVNLGLAVLCTQLLECVDKSRRIAAVRFLDSVRRFTPSSTKCTIVQAERTFMQVYVRQDVGMEDMVGSKRCWSEDNGGQGREPERPANQGATGESSAGMQEEQPAEKRCRMDEQVGSALAGLQGGVRALESEPVMRIERSYSGASCEHRCLVYRSDRKAPVAKLVWTKEDHDTAHVKSVFVWERMRGSGLGRLLFYQLFGTLRRGGVGLLRLEAEEDVSRHNRLVNFYHSLGFRQSENARILYLNNYDEYFRKVPMYRHITPSFFSPELTETDSFSVVVLRSPEGGAVFGDDGRLVGVTGGSPKGKEAEEKGGGSRCQGQGRSQDLLQHSWMLVQDVAGGIAMLDNHGGKFLCAEPDGKVVADRAILSTWEVFELEPYEDTLSSRELFAFKTFHGKYLKFSSPVSSPRAAPPSSSTSASSSPPSTPLPPPPLAPACVEADGDEDGIGGDELDISHGDSGSGGACDGGGGGGEAMDVTAAGRVHHTVMIMSDEPTLWEAAVSQAGGPKVFEVVKMPRSPDRLKKKESGQQKQATVRAIHRKMRRINSVRFVREMTERWTRFDMDHQLTVYDAVKQLWTHYDPLRPELSVSYGEALVYIAQHIRKQTQVDPERYPEWMQLVGILHGLGRVVFLREQLEYDSRDWAFGGQSWVVGCRYSSCIRYPDLNELNEDFEAPEYSTQCGMYTPHCGLDQVLLNFSGSEYMWHLLRGHPQRRLPPEAIAIVRYADLDMWHSGTQYDHFASAHDQEVRPWVARFDRIRSEALSLLPLSPPKTRLNLDTIWPYYQALIDKYMPGPWRW